MKSSAIRINSPVKGSLPGIVKVTPRTIAMINALRKKGDYLFNTNVVTVRKGLNKERK